MLVLAGASIMGADGGAGKAQYVGAKSCRLCHIKEYKTWSDSKHAQNFDVLQGAERQNAECLKCHTTGYGEPGGFTSEADTPDLENTGCESCHGAGSEHVAAAKQATSSSATEWEKKINRVPQNTCINCHNPHINQKKRVEELRKGKTS
jgi:hypothetical protein